MSTATANSPAQRREQELKQWYDSQSQQARALRQAYELRGFELFGTGGNCTAFYHECDDRYILVTVIDDPSAPSDPQERIIVGLHCFQHSEPLKQYTYRTSTTFLRELDEYAEPIKLFTTRAYANAIAGRTEPRLCTPL